MKCSSASSLLGILAPFHQVDPLLLHVWMLFWCLLFSLIVFDATGYPSQVFTSLLLLPWWHTWGFSLCPCPCPYLALAGGIYSLAVLECPLQYFGGLVPYQQEWCYQKCISLPHLQCYRYHIFINAVVASDIWFFCSIFCSSYLPFHAEPVPHVDMHKLLQPFSVCDIDALHFSWQTSCPVLFGLPACITLYVLETQLSCTSHFFFHHSTHSTSVALSSNWNIIILSIPVPDNFDSVLFILLYLS